jgi:hypothetical protein
LALKDANAAVQEITGNPLPEGFRARVLERAGYDVTLVLPDPEGAAELADEELEQVAGGAQNNFLDRRGLDPPNK